MRLILLEDGNRIISNSQSAILPAGVETVKEINLDTLSEDEQLTIVGNLDNDKVVNQVLEKVDESVSIKIDANTNI